MTPPSGAAVAAAAVKQGIVVLGRWAIRKIGHVPLRNRNDPAREVLLGDLALVKAGQEAAHGRDDQLPSGPTETPGFVQQEAIRAPEGRRPKSTGRSPKRCRGLKRTMARKVTAVVGRRPRSASRESSYPSRDPGDGGIVSLLRGKPWDVPAIAQQGEQFETPVGVESERLAAGVVPLDHGVECPRCRLRPRRNSGVMGAGMRQLRVGSRLPAHRGPG